MPPVLADAGRAKSPAGEEIPLHAFDLFTTIAAEVRLVQHLGNELGREPGPKRIISQIR